MAVAIVAALETPIERSTSHRFEESPAVGVFRPGKKPLSVSCLPDLSVAKHEHVVRHHLCDGEVVGHEDAAEADLLLEVT